MSLRIAWSSYPRNTGLGIAASVFVYVGTIILFMINWFFVQRIVRAQHQRIGWSTPYRIFHRAALVVLIACLIMIIMASIWQFFTINETKLHAFRAMQLTGQTYFTIFCFAPAVLVLISNVIPRTEIEKFGAGRLRVNIVILLIAVMVLGAGQLFRCVIAWIPQTPVRDASGTPIAQPGYLHRACFYVFNFVTEIAVVIMFAVVRVDLRFYVPNGSRMSGDYSGRNSRVNLNSNSNVALSDMASKKSLAAVSTTVPMSHHKNDSMETLHQYETSVFEDSRTLADSLQYTGSTLEVDSKTGAYKVKRLSGGSTSSRGSTYKAQSPTRSSFRSSMHDRSVKFEDEAPPVPEIPAAWPLRTPTSGTMRSSVPSRKESPKKAYEIPDHDLNDADVGNAITCALAALEHNSKHNTPKITVSRSSPRFYPKSSATPPPEYANVSTESLNKQRKNPLAPKHRATFPPKSALKTSSRVQSSANSSKSSTPTINETPELPPPVPTVPSKAQPARRSSSLEFIKISQQPQPHSSRILDMSLQGNVAGDVSTDVSRPDTANNEAQTQMSGAIGVDRAPSPAYSQGTTKSDEVEKARAEEEFSRFSHEAVPLDQDIMKNRRFD